MNDSINLPRISLTMVVAQCGEDGKGLDFEGLVAHLSECLNMEIKLNRCRDYSEAMAFLSNGSAQIGWLGLRAKVSYG